MTAIDRFDPFTNRLCRNVRNALSEAFMDALQAMDMLPVRQAAGYFIEDTLPEPVRIYIDRRMAAYADVLADIRRQPSEDPLDVAMRIWDRRLFFETHEYLEPFWMRAEGEQRTLLQALIRAAGTYVHLERGHRKGAERIAAKAIAGIARHQDRLAGYVDARLLLAKLKSLDPEPPVLSGSAGSAPPDR